MGRYARLDCELDKRRFADEYQGPSEFAQKVKTINFNFNDDCINGVFELDSDYEPPDPSESQNYLLEANVPKAFGVPEPDNMRIGTQKESNSQPTQSGGHSQKVQQEAPQSKSHS